jgi:uncharacterized protein
VALSALAIFGREPIAGRVKTRLIEALGAEGSAALYRAFLDDTLEKCRALDGFDVSLWLADPPVGRIDLGVRVEVQAPGDLGARMADAIARELASHERVVIAGSDAPTLPAEHLRRLVALLDEADLALGPAADGGFYAIGARARIDLAPSAIEWSTSRALGQTIARAREHRLAVALTSPWYDVDTADDLRLLRAHLAIDPGAASRTARVLGCAR